ncbi:MAG: nucleotidyltransferase family protein [Conexivisphaerales archaeon]
MGGEIFRKVKKVLKEHREELREKYGVKEIGIFGSYVRGENKESSDLDILVEFEDDAKIDLIKFVELENYLSELLGVKVDLVDKTALKPAIGKHILQEVVYP